MRIFSRKNSLQTYHSMVSILYLLRKSLKLKQTELHDWHVNNHPLDLLKRFWQVQEILEDSSQSTLKPEDQRDLTGLYGLKIFLCHHPACADSQLPPRFASESERNAHEESHSRPFKCQHSSCVFSIIGFSNRRHLQLHLKKYHHAPNDKPINLELLADEPQPATSGERPRHGRELVMD